MRAAVKQMLRSSVRESSPAPVVCAGDSNVYGYVGVDHATEAWPALLSGLLNGDCQVFNIGVSGRTIQQVADASAAEADIHIVEGASFGRMSKVGNLYIVMYGTNRGTGDLDPLVQWRGPDSDPTKGSKANLLARLAAGFDTVIVAGILPSGTDPVVEGRRLLYKNYNVKDKTIRGKRIYFVDPADVPELADPTDTDYYDGDQTHMNTAGHAVFATWMADFVNDLTGVPA